MIYRRTRKSLVDNNKVRKWRNKLLSVPCFILGNSPYLNDHPIHKLNDCFTIGINRAYKKIDPTILIWQDIEFYVDARKDLSKLKAILYSRNLADPVGMAYHFRLLDGDYRLTNNAAVLAGRGSTGPLAVQLAYILGCDPIVLVGYNCRYRDGLTDFYGVNRDHKPHTLNNCSRGLGWIQKNITDRKIIVCSESDTFVDTMSLEQVISLYNVNFKREYLKKILVDDVLCESNKENKENKEKNEQ